MVSQEHRDNVCLQGKGKECCSYLGMGPNGWQCLKLTSFRTLLDQRRAEGSIRAMGDNCDGIGSDTEDPQTTQ